MILPALSSVRPSSHRWLDVITIALDQESEIRREVSTADLQSAYFDICISRRCVPTLLVTVNQHMHLSRWGNDYSLGYSPKALETQVPSPRAAGVAWRIPAGTFLPVRSVSPLLRKLGKMQLAGFDLSRSGSDTTVTFHWDGLSWLVMPRVLSGRTCVVTIPTSLEKQDIAN